MPNLTALELRVGYTPFDDATKRIVTDTLLWHATRPVHQRSIVRIRAYDDSFDALELCRTALTVGFTDVAYVEEPFDYHADACKFPLNGNKLYINMLDSTGGFASCARLRLTFHCLGNLPRGFVTVMAAEGSLRHLSIRVRRGWRQGWDVAQWDAWQPAEYIRRRRPDLAVANHHLRRLRLKFAGVLLKRTEFARLWSGAMRCFDALDVLEIDVRGSVILDADLRACAREIGPSSPRCVRLRLSARPYGLSLAEGLRALQTAADRAGRGATYHLEVSDVSEEEGEDNDGRRSPPRSRPRYCYCNTRILDE
jgi:hypothetical protein